MDKWASTFVNLDSIDFSGKKNLRRLKKLHFFKLTHPDDLILDLFCGRCDTSYGLYECRPKIINGDLSFNLLKINKQVKNKIQLTSLQLPFKNDRFDAAIIQGGLHHLKTFNRVVECLNEVKRVLKSNGYVFISEPGNTMLLKVWVFLIKRTKLWTLTPYSRIWHSLYMQEEKTHSLYLHNNTKLFDYFKNNWEIKLHKAGLITEFFTLEKTVNRLA